MKRLALIFAGCVLSFAVALAEVISELPNLGAGDPNLLVWMTVTDDLSPFGVFMYAGERKLPEYNLTTDKVGAESLKLLYSHDVGAVVNLDLQHCFPFGGGQGFLRRITRVLKDPKIRSGVDIDKEQSDIVLFEVKNGGLVPRIVSDDVVNREFALASGLRFLGKLDDIVFYWDPSDKEHVFGRDAKTNKTYSWHVPDVYIGVGMLRGKTKDYGFVAFKKISALFATAYGEQTMIEVAIKDATIR